MKKLNFYQIGWAIVFLFIIVNLFILYKGEVNNSSGVSFPEIGLEKPTLLIVFKEFECQSCIDNLVLLNSLYEKLNRAGTIDIKGLILSEENTDRKSIARYFDFPFFISNDFSILRHFNIDKTPLLIGISKTNKLIYFELIPTGTAITEKYLKDGVLERLYYSEVMEK